jgi:hypothetical protein
MPSASYANGVPAAVDGSAFLRLTVMLASSILGMVSIAVRTMRSSRSSKDWAASMVCAASAIASAIVRLDSSGSMLTVAVRSDAASRPAGTNA